jgi:divalent metal cation (Fe/Co/Zn/Cd) transporter
LADPIIGLIITLAIFGIVWQSATAVFVRMLDGVEPSVTAEIHHAAEHTPGILQVLDVRARWLGHRLNAEVDVVLDGTVTVRKADAITAQFERALFQHLPALASVRIRVRSPDSVPQAAHSEVPMAISMHESSSRAGTGSAAR